MPRPLCDSFTLMMHICIEDDECARRVTDEYDASASVLQLERCGPLIGRDFILFTLRQNDEA